VVEIACVVRAGNILGEGPSGTAKLDKIVKAARLNVNDR